MFQSTDIKLPKLDQNPNKIRTPAQKAEAHVKSVVVAVVVRGLVLAARKIPRGYQLPSRDGQMLRVRRS